MEPPVMHGMGFQIGHYIPLMQHAAIVAFYISDLADFRNERFEKRLE